VTDTSSRRARSLRGYLFTTLVGALAAIVVLALVVPRSLSLITSAASYDVEVPELQPLARRSLVLDRDGGVLATLYSEDREPVTLDAVSPWLIDAVIAAEDRDFYEHDGVDVKGTARAFVRNFQAGSVEEGGSTITQQLVKNTLIDDPDRTLAALAQTGTVGSHRNGDPLTVALGVSSNLLRDPPIVEILSWAKAAQRIRRRPEQRTTR
jgi:membrane peptidoglycan carboxypeptidase